MIAPDVQDSRVDIDIFKVETFLWKLKLSETPGYVLNQDIVIVLRDQVDYVQTFNLAGNHQHIIIR
jgi:hypothetical protein